MKILLSNNYSYFQPGPRFLDINDISSDSGLPEIKSEDLKRDDLITRVKETASHKESINIKHNYHNIDGDTRHFDGGIDITIINNLVLTFGSGGAFYAFLKTIRPIIIEWIKYKSKKTIRIEYDDTVIEISGTNDIDKVILELEKVKSARKKSKKKKRI